MFTQT